MKNKINVNISPNPLDLQTLHCSQNDTGERKFYFTLHNNGEVIDTTDISDPIFEPFSVYKGGTEQLLPVNTDDPTTSPIIADIQYPDEEKTEQEFTYRESPTTIDGKALVEKIKGNTIVWNQQAPVYSRDTNGKVAFTTGAKLVQGHKYYIHRKLSNSVNVTLAFYARMSGVDTLCFQVTGATTDLLATSNGTGVSDGTTASNEGNIYIYQNNNGNTVTVTDLMVIDLTAMFGSTKADEIYAMEQSQSGSGVAYFRSLFPLPYYQYGQKLLPFNGTGVKVTGKNLIDPSIIEYGKNWNGNAVATRANYSARLPYGQYTFSIQSMGTLAEVSVSVTSEKYGERSSLGGLTNSTKSRSVTVDANNPYVQFLLRVDSGTVTQTDFESCSLMLESGSTPTTYEPYKSSTTSIPTLTYFPTGMKSAGSVYDELSNNKAVTRIGEVDLGSLSWTINTTYNNIFQANLADCKQGVAAQKANILCAKYETEISGANSVITNQPDKTIRVRANSTVICILDSTYSTAEALTTALDGIYLNYELTEEQATEFTHASLICEDGESNLYQDDDLLVCECTEDFSKDSGFKDCKIKLTNDDGVVYSNKIQLHIERKP